MNTYYFICEECAIPCELKIDHIKWDYLLPPSDCPFGGRQSRWKIKDVPAKYKTVAKWQPVEPFIYRYEVFGSGGGADLPDEISDKYFEKCERCGAGRVVGSLCPTCAAVGEL